MNKQIIKYSNIDNNENTSMCSKCGGKCCKRLPGGYHPSDFGCEITEELLESLINDPEHPISIDWYDDFIYEDKSYPRGYYIRPRVIDGDAVDGSWGGVCNNLTETGCSLSWDDRPWSCKLLAPSENGHCGHQYDEKLSCAVAWLPYRDMIEHIVEKYEKPIDFIDLFDALIGLYGSME